MEVNEQVFIEQKIIQLNGFIEGIDFNKPKELFDTSDFEWVELDKVFLYKGSKNYKFNMKNSDSSVEIAVTYLFDESDKAIISFQIPDIVEYEFYDIFELMMFLFKCYVSSIVSIFTDGFDNGTLIYDILCKCFTKMYKQLKIAQTNEEINKCEVFESIQDEEYRLSALLGPLHGLSLALEYEDWDNGDIKLVKGIIN